MSSENQSNVRGGLDFYTLSRGGDRSYSTSFLVNLDPDLLTLCSREDATPLDLARDALISHTKRIFALLGARSRRKVAQFCFGSTFVQLNPNYRKLDRMDPITWKKEGIATHWTGNRGYRRPCCKVCCQDKQCVGCRNCKGCQNGPIRGNYDGLIVLCALTRESLPNQPLVMRGARQNVSIRGKNEENLLNKFNADHELFAMSLETLLATHFMFGDPDYLGLCVPSARTAILLGDNGDELRKSRKHAAYVVYVAYRLEPKVIISHGEKLSRIKDEEFKDGPDPDAEEQQRLERELRVVRDDQNEDEVKDDEDNDEVEEPDQGGGARVDHRMAEKGSRPAFGESRFGEEEDEKMLEELEDKQLLSRIEGVESVQSTMSERVSRLEHDRSWVENRLTVLEAALTKLTGKPITLVDNEEE